MRETPARPVGPDGPSFGTYAGRFPDTDLRLAERGVGRVRRAVSEKRWQWFGALDGRLAVGGAAVDAGLFGTAFLWVADRDDGELLVDADLLVPAPPVTVATAPADGVVAMVELPRRRLRITRTDDAVAVDARFGGADVALAATTADREAVSASVPSPAATAASTSPRRRPDPVRGPRRRRREPRVRRRRRSRFQPRPAGAGDDLAVGHRKLPGRRRHAGRLQPRCRVQRRPGERRPGRR